VTWRRWALLAAFGSRDMASLGAGRIDELALDVPKSGQSPGARRPQWRPRIMVVVVGGGGGSGKRWGNVTTCDVHDVSTTVARFGNTRASIINWNEGGSN
jgi:hypothetical protein